MKAIAGEPIDTSDAQGSLGRVYAAERLGAEAGALDLLRAMAANPNAEKIPGFQVAVAKALMRFGDEATAVSLLGDVEMGPSAIRADRSEAGRLLDQMRPGRHLKP